jgi:hypothetical protein
MKTELVKLLVQEVSPEEVAESAANGKAVCDMFTCIIRDEVMRDIVVGHAVVVVAYGSELSIGKVKQALLEASSR